MIAGLANTNALALANATALNAILSANVGSLMSTVTAQGETYRQMLVESQAANTAQLNTELVALNSNAAAQDAGIERAVERMTAEAAAAQTTAAAQMSTLSVTLTRSVSTQMAAGTNAINSVNRTATAALVGKMNTRKHHWTGGCSGNRNGGWNWCKSPSTVATGYAWTPPYDALLRRQSSHQNCRY